MTAVSMGRSSVSPIAQSGQLGPCDTREPHACSAGEGGKGVQLNNSGSHVSQGSFVYRTQMAWAWAWAWYSVPQARAGQL